MDKQALIEHLQQCNFNPPPADLKFEVTIRLPNNHHWEITPDGTDFWVVPDNANESDRLREWLKALIGEWDNPPIPTFWTNRSY